MKLRRDDSRPRSPARRSSPLPTHTNDGHWYANFGYYAHDANVAAYGNGGSRLSSWNPRSGELKVILNDPDGGIRDPQVDYEGRKILFYAGSRSS